MVERIGEVSGVLTHRGPDGDQRTERAFADHEDALRAVLEAFTEHGPALAREPMRAVGHRVVHGGPRFSAPALVDDDLVAAVEALVPLAPLHNPANLSCIADAPASCSPTCRRWRSSTPRSTRRCRRTPTPTPSRWPCARSTGSAATASTARRTPSCPGRPRPCWAGRWRTSTSIVLHLGNGASAAAVRGGRSVDTSMGMTPLEGLVMGTRSGDVDPALHAHLHRELGWSVEETDRVLNRESGLKGLAGGPDFRELDRRRRAGDAAATLAFDVAAHRIRHYVGAYYAVLGTVDAVVFTAGIGEHAPSLRAAALSGLERLGIAVDPDRNERAAGGPVVVSPEGSEVAVLVVPTDEEWEIARQALQVVQGL